MLKWTLEEARTYLVNYHFINTKHNPSLDEVFERLQVIQYDPLNVVGNNSDLVLQSRVKNYQKNDIQEALYKHRTLIDGWDKQMSIYQTKYFPHFKRIRERRSTQSMNGYIKNLSMDPREYLDDIIKIIKEEGPILSSKIKLGESIKTSWGSNKPSTATIDYLFHKGLIGIESRKNTQKRYQLIEELIDHHAHAEPIINEEEFIDWYLLRRIKSLGLCWNKSGVHFSGLHIENKKIRTKHLERLLALNLIKKITLEGIKEDFYVPTEALDYPIEVVEDIAFIAPLDNLIWDRGLMELLWNYDYRWEVYVPASKRKWGYYVLPILKGNRFIGRIEFEKQRNNETLIVKNIFYEDHIKQTKTLGKDLNKALKKFAKYLGAKDVKI